LRPRTSVCAYIDDKGDLRIWADDLVEQSGPTEMRINAEDIEEFLLALNFICREAKERSKRKTESATGSTASDNPDELLL
jgi:hypothetical protein